MQQGTLFENLIQQGCRQHETSAETGVTRFEWRNETVYIPPPSDTRYTLFEIQMIARLIGRITNYELLLPDFPASDETMTSAP